LYSLSDVFFAFLYLLYSFLVRYPNLFAAVSPHLARCF